MKKLRLSASSFQKGEVLTRSQLKKVLGGSGSEGGCTPPGGMCNSHGECCQPRGGTVICMINTSSGYGYCTEWN